MLIRWPLMSCTVSLPSLVIRTVYWKIHWSSKGREFSGEYCESTSTRMPSVVVSDTGAGMEPRSAMASFIRLPPCKTNRF